MRRFGPVLIWMLGSLPAFAATPAADFERAQKLVSARCAMCHGLQGQSVSPLYPKLSGQNAEYLVKQLFNFKTGLRTSTVMQPMSADLTAADIDVLARYFAAQPMPPVRVEDPELAAAGRYLYFKGNRWSGVTACANCHGAYGRGGALMPRIAGQNADYIEGRLRTTATTRPTSTIELMHSSIAPITEFEIRALAQYVSGVE